MSVSLKAAKLRLTFALTDDVMTNAGLQGIHWLAELPLGIQAVHFKQSCSSLG